MVCEWWKFSVSDHHCDTLHLPLVNKEEVVPKARPVSTDVGSTNPNFSDLMDEFIQERLRAKGTSVSTAHTRTRGKSVSVWQTFSSPLCTRSGSPWQQPGKPGGSQGPAGAPGGGSQPRVAALGRPSSNRWPRRSLRMDLACKCQWLWCHQLRQPVGLLQRLPVLHLQVWQ